MAFFGTIAFIVVAVGIALLSMRVRHPREMGSVPRWLAIVTVYGINLCLLYAALAVLLESRLTLSGLFIAACVAGSCLAGAVSLLESAGEAVAQDKSTSAK